MISKLLNKIRGATMGLKFSHLFQVEDKHKILKQGRYTATIKGVHEEVDGTFTLILENVRKPHEHS